MESTETEIRKLLDRAAIGDLFQRYSRALDQRDWDEVVSCFTPDAYADYGLIEGGVDEVVRWIRQGVAVFDKTMHFIQPQVIEVDGDTAHAEAYCVAYHRRTDAGQRKELLVRLRYIDELVRAGEAWLIQRRTIEYVFGRESEVVLDE